MATRHTLAEISIVWKFLMPYSLLEWININYQLNEHATTTQDDTGTTELIGMPQLELLAILRVRIECHK